MKFDLVAPCAQCPFRSDREPFISAARAAEILRAITTEQKSFSCHKTVEHDDDGDYVPRDDEQHCSGALIMLERLEKPNQIMRIAERVGFYDRTKLKMDSPVLASPAAMVAHHRKGRRK